MARKKATAKKPIVNPSIPEEIDVHYIKSAGYRLVCCDGVIGGMTPRGKIVASIYAERSPIPQKVRHKIENGQLGKVIYDEGKTGVIRELEAAISFDVETAIQFRDWLSDRIKEVSKIIELSDSKGKK